MHTEEAKLNSIWMHLDIVSMGLSYACYDNDFDEDIDLNNVTDIGFIHKDTNGKIPWLIICRKGRTSSKIYR